MKLSPLFVFGLSLILTSCVTPQPEPLQPLPQKKPEVVVVQQDVSKVDTAGTTTSSYTAVEVSKHATKDDCWLILDGGVYDVTSYIPRHPGGDKILRGCGQDATQMFAKHPDSAKALKEQFKIGKLAQ